METEVSIRKVIESLHELSIAHMLVGSLSSNAWGFARSTVDADVVIETNAKIDLINDRINPVFRPEPQLGFETIQMTTKYLYYHRETEFGWNHSFSAKTPTTASDLPEESHLKKMDLKSSYPQQRM